MEKELPKRKEIRLKQYDYSSPGAYFITICTENRKNYFWEGAFYPQRTTEDFAGEHSSPLQCSMRTIVGQIVFDELKRWHKTYSSVSLHAYVIMPNHIHIMVAIIADEYGRPQVAPTLERMVKQFKGAVTKKIGCSIWQKSFIEHIVRNQNDYETRLNYMYNNPMRWYYDKIYKDE